MERDRDHKETGAGGGDTRRVCFGMWLLLKGQTHLFPHAAADLCFMCEREKGVCLGVC